jgi:hypothetical protein
MLLSIAFLPDRLVLADLHTAGQCKRSERVCGRGGELSYPVRQGALSAFPLTMLSSYLGLLKSRSICI